jgi:hypothetical protein
MLLRLAFWLTVVVFLLPSDPQQQARLHAALTGALARAGGFCDRNTGTCSAGGEVWATFLRKAEFGMRLVGDLIGGARTPPDAAPPPADWRGPGRAEPRGRQLPPGFYRPPGRGPGYGGG